MDVMDLRSIITVISFLAFIGIVFWAYGSHQKPRFDEASRLPFADDEMQARTVGQPESDGSACDHKRTEKVNTEVANG
jgi:cytochrome c oxidase cbb3-type subunit 4